MILNDKFIKICQPFFMIEKYKRLELFMVSLIQFIALFRLQYDKMLRCFVLQPNILYFLCLYIMIRKTLQYTTYYLFIYIFLYIVYTIYRYIHLVLTYNKSTRYNYNYNRKLSLPLWRPSLAWVDSPHILVLCSLVWSDCATDLTCLPFKCI